MKKIFLMLLGAILIIGCKKKDVPVSTVIHDLTISDRRPLADGTTIIDISVYIDSLADADKRGVAFTSSAGMFLPSKDTTITQTANFENGQLVARVKFQVPQQPGPIYLKAEPAVQSRFNTYQILDSIQVQPSLPATLTLLPSLLGIKTGLNNEITLTATLKNAQNSSVSFGTKVSFDQIGFNGPVSGSFRISRDITDATSTATASYTAGSTPVGTTFYLRCTYIDPFGNPSLNIKDSCLITVVN